MLACSLDLLFDDELDLLFEELELGLDGGELLGLGGEAVGGAGGCGVVGELAGQPERTTVVKPITARASGRDRNTEIFSGLVGITLHQIFSSYRFAIFIARAVPLGLEPP